MQDKVDLSVTGSRSLTRLTSICAALPEDYTLADRASMAGAKNWNDCCSPSCNEVIAQNLDYNQMENLSSMCTSVLICS